MLTLPRELETIDFSLLSVGQPRLGPRFGESNIIEFIDPLRDGIAMLFCVVIGEESGDDSAKVEWWRLVEAREKSSPRECRGIEVAGMP